MSPGASDVDGGRWTLDNLPAPVRAALDHLLGAPVAARRVLGPGGAGVWCVRGRRGAAAVKLAATGRELHFYQQLAPRLVSTPLAVPRPLAAGPDPVPWLILPWLPEALPRSRWAADPEVMGWLRAWHACAAAWREESHPWFPFAWADDLSDAALALLAPPDAAWFRKRIGRWQAEANQVLWQPLTVVHGDPNPTNWRLTDQGRPVLLDWARYGLGHPALDVAISLPGLPTPAAAAEAARRYGRSKLGAGLILLAKLYVVLEFLAMAARGEVRPAAETLDGLRKLLRPWVATALPAVGLPT